MRTTRKAAKRRAIVVIISHRDTLTEWELISLRQCVRVLGRHPMTLVCPEGMETAWYRTSVPELPIAFVDRRWLSSYANFNAFKVSPFLYEMYREYEYILFYEPDAFVFSDRLEEWCAKAYDYIGAPWFEGMEHPTADRLVGVGNGGFSLRNVETHLRISRGYETEQLLFRGYRRHVADKLRFLRSMLAYSLGFSRDRPSYLGPSYYGHEDLFWGRTAPKRDPSFRIAPPEVAMSFSFEAKPRVLYGMNGGRLPFGCHAWYRYDLAFWRPFIESFGYALPETPPAARRP